MANQVIPISLGMVNTYLIKGEGNVLVDAGLPGNLDAIVNALHNHGVEPRDLSLIVVTHNHTDHVGGLKRLKALSGAKLAIHKSEAEGLSLGKSADVIPVTWFGRMLIRLLNNSSFDKVDADVLVDKELDMKDFGIQGRLIHTPGHTPGSVSVLLDSGELIVGDLFSARRGKASRPIFATDTAQLKETLKLLAEMTPSIIYTSHGNTCTLKELMQLISKL